MQPDDFAHLVVMTVQNAVAPFAERLAKFETLAERAVAIEKTQTELRDRLVAIETKAGMPPAPDPAIGELRERLSAVETKSVAPVAPAAIEQRSDDTRDRVLALETKGAQPLALEHTVTDLRDRFDRLETRLHDDAAATTTLRERIAVLETRAPMPGPPGKDGHDGKDGADGMGVKDFVVEHDGERTFTVKYTDGARVKTAGEFTIPATIYRGVFTEGKTYEPGDSVTWAGSTWVCKKATVLKPESVAVDGRGENGKDFWTLAVKAGREGKAGRDGRDATTLPIVSVRGGPTP